MQVTHGFGRALAALALVVSAGCITPTVHNTPVDHIDFEASYRPSPGAQHRGSEKVWLVLAFSGGGTRAAAFAYGVLQELRDTEVGIDGKSGRLLDQVDTISGVSGGSFPAAYYGLFGDRIFDEFEERFIRHDVEGALLLRALIPWNFVLLMTPALNRTDLASRWYDAHVFEHATFADLARAPGPEIFINASDLTAGNRITFTQSAFDVICSDLAVFPISSATAASSAVPGLLSPLTLRNYAGRCGFEPPAWFKAAMESRDTDPRRWRVMKSVLPYLEPDRKRYIHLVDGGIADNLGVRVVLDRIELAGGVAQFAALEEWTPPDHVIAIVVDAETEPDPAIDLHAVAPGVVDTMGLVSSSLIRRVNDDTLDLVDESVQAWARELSGPGHTVTGHVVEVSFERVRDPERRAYLQGLPTSFSLDKEQVDRLIEAARTILRDSQQFQAALKELRP
jgi:NTE family protein